ncbi:hypothetical protein SAMN05216267_101620 [Actinacidiphila rubida]|uniref:Uncharacterized protein n=1 Tax=Actinacidiphila rubida TaxID=310780 RepID=A0A1H8LJ48_9ACTN|nr:hypothetical protein SAMN05216267_101620 [Actinacidiphila rubida]
MEPADARGRLRPVLHKARWISGGLALQLVGLAGPIAYVVSRAKHESIGGLLTVTTVKLAWHESAHERKGIAILAAGAIVFALGSVLLARPFVKRRLTLLVAVPLAAVCGALVLGVAALIVTLICLLEGAGGDIDNIPGGGGSSRKSPADPAAAALPTDAGPPGT